MEILYYYLTPLAVAAVILVLFLGLWNMLRGGSASLSQKLMRWRIALQLFAIVLLMLTIYLTSR